jgi:periplasmic protein TonB
MAQTGIFEERDRWARAILVSIGLHLALAIAIVIGGYMRGAGGQNWGGDTSGEAVQANLISAVPLPAPQEPTQNIVATENKGLTQSIPKQEEQQPDAVPIPEKPPKRTIEKNPITPTRQKPLPTVQPPPNNVVPYGQGGPISGPYGAFTATNVKGGFSFQGGGDFGSRYAWYVQVVNRKVSNNWYTMEVGQNGNAHRVYILFDIQPDGSPTNVRIEQSSGVPALDQSAIRAIQRIDGFGATPSGGRVSVEFWFDYQR